MAMSNKKFEKKVIGNKLHYLGLKLNADGELLQAQRGGNP